jgi:hypothetical protein
MLYGILSQQAWLRQDPVLRRTSQTRWLAILLDFSVAFSLSDVSEIEHFVAREEELAEMHRTLSGDGSRHTIVLHGLGGIGKTQLTVAYAKWHKDSYSAVFWLNIEDEDSLKQSFAKVAKQILREHPLASQLSSVDVKENLDEITRQCGSRSSGHPQISPGIISRIRYHHNSVIASQDWSSYPNQKAGEYTR